MKNLFNIENGFKVAVVLLLSIMAFGANAASVSGNVGLGSDYVFRGQSQTQGDSALSMGLDLDIGGGFYAGVWASEVDFAGSDADRETDMYVGWSGSMGDVSLDVGYTDYAYSGDESLDGTEYYINVGYADFGLTHVIGEDGFKDYSEVQYNVLGMLDISYGTWDTIGDNWSVSRSFDMPYDIEGTIAYVDFSAEDGSGLADEDTFVFSVAKTF